MKRRECFLQGFLLVAPVLLKKKNQVSSTSVKEFGEDSKVITDFGRSTQLALFFFLGFDKNRVGLARCPGIESCDFTGKKTHPTASRV